MPTNANFNATTPGFLVSAQQSDDGRSFHLPNFFIIGAPKCGTTSLASWLGQHPQIHMCSLKEPNFFNTDGWRVTVTLEAYTALFKGAGEQHRAIGEASTSYFSSNSAVRNILHVQPNARFIVMLRNPLEMAPALHAQMVLSGMESIRNFRGAWDLQGDRQGGRHLPLLEKSGHQLMYGEICSLGKHLDRLFRLVSGHYILPVVLEDLSKNPRREYLRVLNFLNVQDDARDVFPILNKASVPRTPILARAMHMTVQLKYSLGIRRSFGFWRHMLDSQKSETPWHPLSYDTAALLHEYFADDIRLLGRLLARDLEHWLHPPGQVGETTPGSFGRRAENGR